MTLDYLKDLIFDALNESEALNLSELHWKSGEQVFALTTEDGSRFLLRPMAQNDQEAGRSDPSEQ